MALESLGLLPLSLNDFPGRVAAVLFTAGCLLRCPYCHNPSLLSGTPPDDFLPRMEALSRLRRRRDLLQGVVISGGEPTMHRDLPGLVNEVACMGFAVKLDTSGVQPEVLARTLVVPGLEMVALDLKTDPALYERVGCAGAGEAVRESLALLRAWRDEADTPGSPRSDNRRGPATILPPPAISRRRSVIFRTTLAPGIATGDDLAAIESLLGTDAVHWTTTEYRLKYAQDCVPPRQ